MRLEQLYYLIEVSRSRSISFAAERAHVSQPALSASINKLEDELGVKLLKRTNQGVYPTEIGEIIVTKAQEIINGIEEIKTIAKNNVLELSGDVLIASEMCASIAIMSKVFTTFKSIHPKVKILIKVGESHNILRDIQAGKADLGIILKTDELINSKDIQNKEIISDRLVVITGKNNEIAEKGEISLEEALAQPIILFNTEYVTNCGISSILKKYGEIHVSYRIDNLPMLEKLLREDNNISFVPSIMANEFIKNENIVMLPLKEDPLHVSVVMIWSFRHHLSTAEKEIIREIKRVAVQANESIK